MTLEELTHSELVATAQSLGYLVDIDTKDKVLKHLIEDKAEDPDLGSLSEGRARIHKVIRTFWRKGRLVLDCDGDCYSCPAAQVTHCWMTSSGVIKSLEERMSGEKKGYTYEELSQKPEADLYRIGHTEADIPRLDVYSLTRSELVVQILSKCGLDGEAAKAAKAAEENSIPETKSEGLHVVSDTTPTDAPAEPARRKAPRRIKATAQDAAPEASTAEAPAPAAVAQPPVDDPTSEYGDRLAELIAGICRQNLTTKSDDTLSEKVQSLADDLDSLAKLSLALRKSNDALVEGLAQLTRIVGGVIGVDNLSGTSPLELIKDLDLKSRA